MDDLSLRHIPDISNASAIADFSDASFQIPRAADDLLLADDTIDFFNGADDTLSTPAPPSRPAPQPPLTLAELTPRSKPMRAVPVRSSLRPRPGIATPHKAAVVNKLSAALAEDLSPFRHQDPSFQIPPQQTDAEDLLMADEGSNFFQGEEPWQDSVPSRARSPLTLSQLSPGPHKRMPSPTNSDAPSSTIRPSYSVIANDGVAVAAAYERDIADIQPPAATVANVVPVIAEVLSAGPADRLAVEQPAEKGMVKRPPQTNHAKEQKKLPGGDKAKRKRVTPVAAVTKPAKLKPLTASIARRISLGGKKTVPGMRRRPLQAPPAAAATRAVSVRRVDGAAQPASSAVLTDVKPTRAGGVLADTLLSFGQRFMASTARADNGEDAPSANDAPNPALPATDVPTPTATSRHPTAWLNDGGDSEAIAGPSSRVSPRGSGIGAASPTLASGSLSPAGAPADVLDQHATEPQVSEARRSPSPMRRSIKRAGSPACEPPAQQRKRNKITSVPSAPPASKEPLPRKPALQPSRSRNTAAASNGARARRVVSASASTANLGAKTDGARQPAVAPLKSLSQSGPGSLLDGGKPKGPLRDEIVDSKNGAHVSTSSRGAKSRDAIQSQKENLTDAKERQTHERRDGLGHASSSTRGISSADRQPTSSSSAKPTKPMEFQFATSMRGEARRADLEKSASGSGSSHTMSLRQSKVYAAHPIPDFKALHAMQQSMLAQRKAEIAPVVPLQIELSTEARAREREQFEEARRAREAELERQREERRRQQELEEEQEIRELRKRAVPKANEVPEWYALAPKKSRAGSGTGN
ncbi:hypothetical protein TRAPUB_6439 [Trametes pubescens]|uniref:TPX2 C-terminal domain-containing protein n=1 Tax=Trametes pubescens TaxID=154538 RepID=A0A1M2V6I8_TRAPU|nr:hypothetical protein TRAPUB_6439 [Trametes pubescens]